MYNGILNLSVRTYFDSKIMGALRFKALQSQKKDGRDEPSYRFHDLPIKFDGGQFYIDSIEGVIPEQLKEFLANRFSIHEYYINGAVRPRGTYEDKAFPKAQAEVQSAEMNGKATYHLYAVGNDLNSVIGLFRAIVKGDLAPVADGKSTAEQLEEERQKLAGCEAMIAQLQEQNAALDHGAMILEGAIDHLQIEADTLKEKLVQTRILQIKTAQRCRWYIDKCKELHNAWYRLPFIFFSEFFIHRDTLNAQIRLDLQTSEPTE